MHKHLQFFILCIMAIRVPSEPENSLDLLDYFLTSAVLHEILILESTANTKESGTELLRMRKQISVFFLQITNLKTSVINRHNTGD